MTTFAILSILVTLAAVFGVVSSRVLRLPITIGTMMLTLGCSGLLLFVGHHAAPLPTWAVSLAAQIDFNAVVLHGLLALLLFAGSLHLDLEQLRLEKLSVLLLAIVSTVLSTFIVGAGLRLLLRLAGLQTSWLGCLLFGALISPTDPVAVLEMLQRVKAPRVLKAQLAGESLFNDGVGAVLFLSLLAASAGKGLPTPTDFLVTLAIQAGGGIALGLVLGYLTYRLLRIMDDFRVEVLLTLALAMGGYALADALGVSMPLEAVTAGLLINGQAREFAMSSNTRAHVDQFWSVVDDILNAVLFLLLGLEVLAVPLSTHRIVIGLCTVPIVLGARFFSVAAVLLPLRWLREKVAGNLYILTWGGLRGSLSVALALSLPRGQERDLMLGLTYIVVVASVIGQGTTMGALLRRLPAPAEARVPKNYPTRANT